MEDINFNFERVGKLLEEFINFSIIVFDKKIYLIGVTVKQIFKIYLFDGEHWENLQIDEISEINKKWKNMDYKDREYEINNIKSIVFNDNLYIFYGINKFIKYDKKIFLYDEINILIMERDGDIDLKTIFPVDDYILFYCYNTWYNFYPDTKKVVKSSLPIPWNFKEIFIYGNNLYIIINEYRTMRKFNIKTKEEKDYLFNDKFHCSALLCYNDIIYRIGGYNFGKRYTVDFMETFNTNDSDPSWKRSEIIMNEERKVIKAVIYNDSIYIMGISLSDQYINKILTVEKYNLKPLSLIKLKKPIINKSVITQNIHKSFVYSTVYNNNYTKFISTSGDSTLILWNITHTDKKIIDIKIERILIGHDDRVVCVAWKLCENECASGSNDCSVIIWNTIDGSIIKKYDDHDDIVRSVDYNKEGILASGSDDKTVIVYNEEKIILHHKNRVRCIKWNPVSGNLLLSGCDDFSITLWNVINKTIIRTFKEHTNFIYSLAWKDETTFASSSGDGTIIIWNTEEVRYTKVLTGHEGNVWSIDWKEDVLVSGGNDKKILVWDTTNYTNHELTGHDGYVLAVNIDNNSNIISGGTDNIIKVWN